MSNIAIAFYWIGAAIVIALPFLLLGFAAWVLTAHARIGRDIERLGERLARLDPPPPAPAFPPPAPPDSQSQRPDGPYSR